MKSSDGYVQAYNGQAVVDEEHQIIVAQGRAGLDPAAEARASTFNRTG